MRTIVNIRLGALYPGWQKNIFFLSDNLRWDTGRRHAKNTSGDAVAIFELNKKR
jgi:hypothetical protein